jgi:hypothetical protein
MWMDLISQYLQPTLAEQIAAADQPAKVTLTETMMWTEAISLPLRLISGGQTVHKDPWGGDYFSINAFRQPYSRR